MKEKCTQNIYRCLNNDETVATPVNSRSTVLSTYLSKNICVTDVFKICFKITSDASIQWFQNRIIYRILPVYYKLKRINVVTSDGCSFIIGLSV